MTKKVRRIFRLKTVFSGWGFILAGVIWDLRKQLVTSAMSLVWLVSTKVLPWIKNNRWIVIGSAIVAVAMTVVVIIRAVILIRKRLPEIQNIDKGEYYRTIQEAINEADDGETILVSGKRPISGLGNRDIDFKKKAITVKAKEDAKSTTIDCEKRGRAFCFFRGETSESVVSGFAITNSRPKNEMHRKDSKDGAIECFESSPTIENNLINENHCSGIYCGSESDNSRTAPIIRNNEICRNRRAGIYCTRATPKIINNTIVGNQGKKDKRECGILTQVDSKPEVINTIIWGNDRGDIDGGSEHFACYSNLQKARKEDKDNHNIITNPSFANIGKGDYHLSDDSPCRSAGRNGDDIPKKDIEGKPRPAIGRNNPSMGVYEIKQ